jgi:hypothetical protein
MEYGIFYQIDCLYKVQNTKRKTNGWVSSLTEVRRTELTNKKTTDGQKKPVYPFLFVIKIK